MVAFDTRRASAFSAAISSRTGARAWQGPHHSAHRSTTTGSPAPATSSSKVVEVNACT